MPKLPETAKTAENFVHGCRYQWLVAEVKPNEPTDGGSESLNRRRTKTSIEFIMNSDAVIVNGLIAVLMIVFNGRTPREILATDAGGCST
ncbi:MAG: SufE family protein [Pirellulaceae bacterium]